MKITASDLGGPRGRKIFFYSHTGEVLLKRLHSSKAFIE
jgi:chemotaxis protein CheD